MSDLPRRRRHPHAYDDDGTASYAVDAYEDGDDDEWDAAGLNEGAQTALGWREALHTRVSQHRGRIVLGVLLLASLYFLAAFGEQALRIRELQAQTGDLEAGNAEVRATNHALAAKLAQWDAGGYLPYVEGRARRDLLLARPDEQVIAVRWHDPAVLTVPQQESTPEAEEQPNWRRWLQVLTGDGDSGTDDADSTTEQTP